jgi:hypothetical protein
MTGTSSCNEITFIKSHQRLRALLIRVTKIPIGIMGSNPTLSAKISLISLDNLKNNRSVQNPYSISKPSRCECLVWMSEFHKGNNAKTN